VGFGVVFVFYLIVSIALLPATYLLCRFVRRRQSPSGPLYGWLLKVFPFVVSPLPVLGFVLGILWKNNMPEAEQFETAFDMPADQSIKVLYAKTTASTDSQFLTLSFVAPEPYLDDIVAPSRFTVVGKSQENDLLDRSFSESSPVWPAVQACPSRDVLHATNYRNWDEMVVVRCRSDGVTYLAAQWVV